MKNCKIVTWVFLFVLIFSNNLFGGLDLYAQNAKNRARINADFVKVVDGEHYLNLKASARVDRETVELSGIELTVFQVVDDEEMEIGKISTDAGGKGKFVIDNFNRLQPDSEGVYHLLVSFDGNDSFKRASREVSFKNADIRAEWIVKDSVNYISARLVDVKTDSAVAEVPLTVRVDRLFRPLKLGKEFYDTDDEGDIEVAIEEGIPGVDGNLTIEVVLSESEDYGTVIAKVVAPIGTVITDQSTFDQRTMWSPRGKTPIFLLGLTYSFILVVWGIFIYLFINLVRIIKS